MAEGERSAVGSSENVLGLSTNERRGEDLAKHVGETMDERGQVKQYLERFADDEQ